MKSSKKVEMEKPVALRFKNRFEMIEFRTTIGLTWNEVDLDKLVLTSPLSEREIELALHTYNAELIKIQPSAGDEL